MKRLYFNTEEGIPYGPHPFVTSTLSKLCSTYSDENEQLDKTMVML